MGDVNAQRVYQVRGYCLKENDEALRSILKEKIQRTCPTDTTHQVDLI